MLFKSYFGEFTTIADQLPVSFIEERFESNSKAQLCLSAVEPETMELSHSDTWFFGAVSNKTIFTRLLLSIQTAMRGPGCSNLRMMKVPRSLQWSSSLLNLCIIRSGLCAQLMLGFSWYKWSSVR